ncbi:endoglucanase [Anaeromyxobacter sp. PSR-1]|nr:endoglucanase [Anaeromyxobacter sp. PSR-1]
MRNRSWVVALAALACSGSGGSSGPPPEVPQASAPTFSPPGGTYASAQQVTVSTATPGATVRCTLDGSEPTEVSPACTSVDVVETTTVRAIALAPGYASSAVASSTYTIDAAAPSPAEPPTFSPPGGVYASAQQVTVASTTPGATVRCTLDGTQPTPATPACADPVTISVSATLRAIATADGFAASAVRSAAYTIQAQPPPVDPTVAQQLEALASKRQLFAHQSVGNSILYGQSGHAGLDALLQANAAAGVAVVYEPASADGSAFPAGGWADTAIGTNGDPVGKVNDFDHQVRVRFGGALDFVAFKFCFTDIWNATDVADTWARYQVVMDALEADFPGRVIHFTVPLMPDVTDIEGNTAREQLSELIRARYRPTGRVFDLADLEAHDAQDNLVTLGGVRALALDWSGDGHFDAHLNDAGADRVARAYVAFMYAVAIGAAR